MSLIDTNEKLKDLLNEVKKLNDNFARFVNAMSQLMEKIEILVDRQF